jgi:hypothetical protein
VGESLPFRVRADGIVVGVKRRSVDWAGQESVIVSRQVDGRPQAGMIKRV